MARPKNDGRGRLGGRAPGTPNKDKPLKETLRAHSQDYFTRILPEEGKTQFQLDLMELDPATRMEMEAKFLRFHLPQMSSVTADLTHNTTDTTLEDRLAKLASE